MRWIKDHALFFLIAFGVIGAFVFAVIRRKDAGTVKELVEKLELEKKVIDQKAAAAKHTARLGHKRVAEEIKKDHEKAIAKMDEEDRKKVEVLEDDPEALVEHLLRVSA